MVELLEAALGLGNRAVELPDFDFGGGDLVRARGQQDATLGRTKIRGEIVEIAKHARIGQPNVRDAR